jgi:hypothetical protein
MSIPGIIDGVLAEISENQWGGFELQVKRESLDQKGRPLEFYTDIRVAPFQVEKGLHNAYRAHVGKIVFIPVQFSIYQKDKGSKPSEQVQLSGLPLQIQRVAPAPAAAAVPPARATA